MKITRRDFVGSAACAGVPFFIGCGSVYAAAPLRRPAPSGRVNVGIIGCGLIAKGTNVPGFLKPIMPVIEVFSAIMKPVSLTIRLFANMLAGHIMILCMVCIIFIMAKYGPLLSGGMTLVSVLFGVFLDALECLVAFIQAYVFTMLSSIYIGMARAHEE